MKLLIDHNLPPRLARELEGACPGSQHVRDVGLSSADDRQVWEYARRHGMMIVSKDSDFHQLSFLLGAPPKVVWLRVGNCSADRAIAFLRDHLHDLHSFAASEQAAFLVLTR